LTRAADEFVSGASCFVGAKSTDSTGVVAAKVVELVSPVTRLPQLPDFVAVEPYSAASIGLSIAPWSNVAAV
jgi:hypothetical protein